MTRSMALPRLSSDVATVPAAAADGARLHHGLAAVAALGLLAALATLQGFFHAFSTFFTLDDQGYLTITVSGDPQ